MLERALSRDFFINFTTIINCLFVILQNLYFV